MALVVHKYGGTSVGSIDRIKAVAERIARVRGGGDNVVVVVSAMAGETNRLFKLAAQLSDSPHPRETDVLVATGEQVSAALLAIRLLLVGARRWTQPERARPLSSWRTASLRWLGRRPHVRHIGAVDPRMAAAQPLFAARGYDDCGDHR